MRKYKRFDSFCILLAMTALASFSKAADKAPPKPEFVIAIHGGAGVEPDKLTDTEKQQYHESLAKALDVGRTILSEGGTSLDAVEKTVRVMEDDPLFNAGRGAVFNSAGQHELDASIMDGATHQGGGVAGLSTVKNPISLARLVMTETRHVLLIGPGAESFADEMRDKPQIECVPNSYFSTDAKRKQWLEAVEKEKHKMRGRFLEGDRRMRSFGQARPPGGGNFHRRAHEQEMGPRRRFADPGRWHVCQRRHLRR